MKIFRIFLTCFSILYAITYIVANICLDHNAPYQSIYWLIGQLGGMLIMFIGWTFVRIKSDEKTWYSTLIYICWLLIFFGYYTYKGITEYKRNTRQDKYGWTFNKNRLIFGIPEIPANWHISSRWNTGIYWSSKKDDTIGHVTKYISIDSFYKDKSEVDDYNLKPVKDVSRSMSIHTYYTQRKILDTDSVVYNYNEFNADFNKTHKISKQQADSILTAENVEKDY